MRLSKALFLIVILIGVLATFGAELSEDDHSHRSLQQKPKPNADAVGAAKGAPPQMGGGGGGGNDAVGAKKGAPPQMGGGAGPQQPRNPNAKNNNANAPVSGGLDPIGGGFKMPTTPDASGPLVKPGRQGQNAAKAAAEKIAAPSTGIDLGGQDDYGGEMDDLRKKEEAKRKKKEKLLAPDPWFSNAKCPAKTRTFDLEVNYYNDDVDASCNDVRKPICNLRAAVSLIGSQKGTIRVPYQEIHRVYNGPIAISQCSEINFVASGEKSNQKSVITLSDVNTRMAKGGNTGMFTAASNSTVLFENMIFKNSEKRVLFARESNITMKNCEFQNQTTLEEGSNIKTEFGKLQLDSCIFYNNSCEKAGAGIYSTYGFIGIKDSNFRNNTGASGIAVASFDTDVLIQRSVFRHNTVKNDGTIFEFVQSRGNVTDSVFTENIGSSGGAIKIGESNMTFKGLSFVHNFGRNVGGCLDVFKSKLDMEGTSFINNTANNVGGAINAMLSNLTCKNCMFDGNEVYSVGGAVQMLQASLKTEGSIFRNNKGVSGAAINMEYSSSCNISSTEVSDNIASGTAGGIRAIQSDVVTHRSKFIKNIGVDGGASLEGSEGLMRLDYTSFVDHYALSGAAVKLWNCTVKGNGSSFTNNTAFYNGAALYTYDSRVALDNAKFQNNSAMEGGAVFLGNSPFKMSGCTFKANNASVGASIVLIGGKKKMVKSKISKTTFRDNICDTTGGGIRTWSIDLTLDGCQFINNTKGIKGSALQADDSKVNVLHTSFENNTAKWGGAIDFKKTDFAFNGSSFINNRASKDGGALYAVNSTSSIISSVFMKNSAKNSGGAIWISQTKAMYSDNYFTQNYAAKLGGAVYQLDGKSEMVATLFEKNKVGRKGVDVYNADGPLTVYCDRIHGLFNAGAKIDQRCYQCLPGSYGDLEKSDKHNCEDHCDVEDTGIPCYNCPFKAACEGSRTCADGYTGELCNTCSKETSCKVYQSCLNIYGLSGSVIVALGVAIAIVVHLCAGKPLDKDHFVRAKQFTGLIQSFQILLMIRNLWPGWVEYVIPYLMPFGLWFELNVASCYTKQFLGEYNFFFINGANLLLPLLMTLVLYRISIKYYRLRIKMIEEHHKTIDQEKLLHYVKIERRFAQFAALLLECTFVPFVYNASKTLNCTESISNTVLVADSSTVCSGLYFDPFRGASLFALIGMAIVFPLIYRYLLIKLHHENKLKSNETCQWYHAFHEKYDYNYALFDFQVMIMKAVFLALIILIEDSKIVVITQAAAYLVYWWKMRKDAPFLPSGLFYPNLHKDNESAKTMLIIINYGFALIVVFAHTYKTRFICTCVILAIDFILTVIIFKNFIFGIKNSNNTDLTLGDVVDQPTKNEIELALASSAKSSPVPVIDDDDKTTEAEGKDTTAKVEDLEKSQDIEQSQ